MPHKAQRRRNQERVAAEEERKAYLEKLPEAAEEKLGVRADFVREVIKSGGIIALVLRPRGEKNTLKIYGGEVPPDKTSSIRGDSIVNYWRLPKLTGYVVKWASGAGDSAAVVATDDTRFNEVQLDDHLITTASEVEGLDIPLEGDGERRLVMSRFGFEVLRLGSYSVSEPFLVDDPESAGNVTITESGLAAVHLGNQALNEAVDYVRGQLFPDPLDLEAIASQYLQTISSS